MIDDDIQTYFLCEGCQRAEDVAQKLADYISQARRSIDISIYSFNLCPEPREIVMKALEDRASHGVSIRIAYDAGSQLDKVDPPVGMDRCDLTTPQFVSELGFPARAIEGDRTLMHNKYVVLDNNTPNARVWTGSTNFTDDSWTLQENNIITLRSEALAALYTHDFEELWQDGNIATSGLMDSGEATLQYKGEPAHVLVNFAPGEGEWIDDSLANQIDRTNESITLAFVVLTSGDIISALQRAIKRGVPIDGVYDWSQMEGVKYQWQLVPANHWKIGAFEEIVQYGGLIGKNSTPYTPTSQHDYMHNKVMLLDDFTVTGSYNFSRHAQQNAENLLLIKSAALVSTYREYIESIKRKYGGTQIVKKPEPTVAPEPLNRNI